MRKALSLFLMFGCLLCIAATGRPQAQPETTALIDKAIKAYGGADKLAKYQGMTFKAKGTLQAMGLKLPYSADYAYQQPDQFRFLMTMEFGGKEVKLTVVSDGKQAWEAAEGKVQEMAKQKFEQFQHSAYTLYVSQILPLKGKAFTLTSAGASKVGERAVVGVTVAHNGRRDVTLYFDKETYLLAKVATRALDEFSGKEVDQENILTNYKDVEGLKFFTNMTIKRDGKVFIEEEFSDQRAVERVDAKLFARPE